MISTATTPLAAPMSDLSGAACVLAVSRNVIKAMVERGQICPAYNFSSGKARYLRIPRQVIENCAAGRNRVITHEDVVNDALNGKGEAVNATACYLWWSIREQLFYRLLRQGLIEASTWHLGRCNAARVNVASLIAFLKSRLITPKTA